MKQRMFSKKLHIDSVLLKDHGIFTDSKAGCHGECNVESLVGQLLIQPNHRTSEGMTEAQEGHLFFPSQISPPRTRVTGCDAIAGR